MHALVIEAVVFDLDGVLLDSEELWDDVRGTYIREHGGRYDADAQRAMMGMSSLEWSRFIHDELGVPHPAARVNADVVALMAARYRRHLPLIDGAVEAVERIAARWPLAIASSANRELIDTALSLSGLERLFRAAVSSEEVPRGKPSPDVYLEACRRLGAEPRRAAAVEDSHSGIRSAKSAGMRVIAVPNPSFPPGEQALAEADVVLAGLADLTPAAVDGEAAG